MTDEGQPYVDEALPPEPEPVQPEPAQEQPQEPPPVYVYAIAMMADGEVKLVTELPFVSVRKALLSDVSMTASYVVGAIKDGKL